MFARNGRRLSFLVVFALIVVTGGCDDYPSPGGNPMAPGGMAPQPGNGAMGPGMGMTGVASEFDYLAQMIPHHEEAIMTAQLLGRGTERQEMRDFAQTIVRTQSEEVAQMKAWLAAWYPGRDTRVTYMPMMRDLTGLRGSALDRAFLEDMIPHHMMAVMMSQQLLNASYARHDEVIPFSRNIRDVQQAEIQMMRQWLMRWF